jgi:hypothetical protein
MFGLGMQANIARAYDHDVGVVLRRYVRIAAARNYRTQTLGRQTAQIDIAGTCDGEVKSIRPAAALNVAAPMNGDLQLILIDPIEEEMA